MNDHSKTQLAQAENNSAFKIHNSQLLFGDGRAIINVE